MAKAKKLKKNIKRLKRKLEQQSSQARKAKREIKNINRELKARGKYIAELQRQVSAAPAGSSEFPEKSPIENSGNKSIAIEQKKAWKRGRFLCERYDLHLNSGLEKDEARALANRDLMESQGKEAGFTAEELRGILS